MRSSGRPWLFSVIAASCAAALLAGCSGDDGTVAVGDGEDRSEESAADVRYCDTAEQVIARNGELDLRTGGPETLADIELLAADAPAELVEDYDTFVTGIRGVVRLDPDDPAALSGILDLMLDPDIASATGAIGRYTASTCGVTLWATPGSDVEGAASDGDRLEIDQVNAAMATLDDGGAAWVAKLSSTVISGGNDVQVATSGDELSDAEALAACSELLAALSASDPDVSISVANDQTVLVTGSDGECAAV